MHFLWVYIKEKYFRVSFVSSFLAFSDDESLGYSLACVQRIPVITGIIINAYSID